MKTPPRIARLLTVLVAAAAVLVTGPVPARADDGLTLVGKLPLIRPEGSNGDPVLHVDPVSRRAFQFYDILGGTVTAVVFDLDTLRQVGDPLPLAIPAFRDQITVDTVRGRLFIPYKAPSLPLVTDIFGGVWVLDTRSLQVIAKWQNPPATDFLRNVQAAVPEIVPGLYGMGLYQPEGLFGPQKLLLVLQDRALHSSNAHAARNLVWIAQWDASGGEQDWLYAVNACTTIFQFKLVPFRSDKPLGLDDEPTPAVYLGCAASGGGGLAVRLLLDQNGVPNGTEQTLPGPLFTKTTISDPPSDRIFFGVEGGEKTSLFAYDGFRSTYVGVIGVSSVVGVSLGIDTTTGRVYAQTSDNGLVLTDGRRTPAQQGLTFPEFRGVAIDVVRVDPARNARPRRVFVRVQQNQFYWVIRDDIPISSDTPLSDLDSRTIDRPEEPGVTGRTFEATGHAYGVRAMTIGGLDGLVPHQDGRGAFRQTGSPCTRFDREIVAGLVTETVLSDGGPKSASIAADADAGTKVDGTDPSERCWPIPDPIGNGFGTNQFRSASDQLFNTRDEQLDAKDALCDGLAENEDVPDAVPDDDPRCKQRPGVAWPFPKAECTGDGTVENIGFQEPTGEGRRMTGFRALAGCHLTDNYVEGVSRAGFDYPGGPTKKGLVIPSVVVGDSSSRVTIALQPNGGVVGIAEAEARDIQIHGIGTIELVKLRAISKAAGRKNTADTEFDRIICGVVLSNYTQPGCADGIAAAAALDRALGPRGRARVPLPDLELAAGTPGGYLASIQKDRTEELAARALSNDFSTQVPGLEIILFNDTERFGRARQVFQFGGVDISTTYGIFLLGSPIPPPIGPITNGPIVKPRFVTITEPGAPGSGGPKTETVDIIEKIRDGFSVLARSPGQAVTAIAVWLALGLPVYLGARRLSLLKEIRGR